MLRFLPRSIRAQVTAVVALVALPLAALVVWAGVREYRSTLMHQERTALTMAEAVAVSAGQFMAQAQSLLGNAARELGPTLIDPDTCSSVAGPVMGVLDFLSNVLVADLEGRVVCSVVPYSAGELDSVLDRPWFQAAVADTGFVVGPPRIGAITRRWVVGIATPIRGADGRPRGVLAGSVDLEDFQGLLTRVRLHDEELLTITTADGVVLARSRDVARWVGTRISDEGIVDEEVFPGGWLAEATDVEGVERVFGKVLIPGVGWKVTLGIPMREARGPALTAAVRWAGLSVFFLLVGVLLARGLYRTVARSLEDLQAGARAAADGDPVVVPDDGPEEVRAVAATLNATLESRRRAEEAERAAKERYRSILDNAVFGIYVSTEDGRFLEVNPALAGILGYPSPDALKEAGPAAVYRDAEERSRLIERQGSEAVISGLETEWVRLDGTPITVRLNGKTVLDAERGRLFEVMVEDITAERRREEELRHHQKLEAVGQLAGGIAHDFNNIMTVIGGNIELIQSSLAPDDPLQADIRQINEATARATQLTSQLLAFSRKSPAEARAVDLTSLVDGVERMLGRLIGADITLRTRLDPGLAPAYADAGRVEQVLVNLVLNSRDALPAGGTIVVEAMNASPSEEGRPRVVLSVVDDGVGMDESTLAHIFEPFFTTKASGRGTGLGLANVYGIVRQAGGEIRVDSSPGRGTRFDVYLPAAETAPLPQRSSAPSLRTAKAKECILLVEDKESVRSLVTRILERDGYTVYVARDGVHALERLQEESLPIDLVLTDVIMPRMKGPELAERLASILPGVPVLFMSGYLDSADLRSRFSRMPDLFLAKPFTANEVKERVRQALTPKDSRTSR